jgi:23S rRNA pseudouridine1911/1915/1917 synthase
VIYLILSHLATSQDELKTIKFILKDRLGISERLLKRLKFAGKIFLNKLPVHVNALVTTGDIVEAHIEFDEINEYVIPEDIDIDILFEDDSIIAINKAPGIVVHPTAGHPSGTIANALTCHLMKRGIKSLIRPVNRLDRDTTGVVVFAANQYVQENLSIQMKSGSFRKEYLGIVYGIIKDKIGSIELPIERKPGSIMLRHVSPTGAPSVTRYEVLEYLNNATLLKFVLETGRTHQIRVHCQAIGHPLIGDTLYPSLDMYPDIKIIERQALHSFRTSFLHPFSKNMLELVAPIPNDMLSAMEILRN